MSEIDAKSNGHPSILVMEGSIVQAVLADRFKLGIYRETRQGPVYELALSPLSSGQRYCRNIVAPRGSVGIEAGTLLPRSDIFESFAGSILGRSFHVIDHQRPKPALRRLQLQPQHLRQRREDRFIF